MTNEDYILEILMEAESMGIRQEVLDLSLKIRQENNLIDTHTSIEESFQYLKLKIQEYNSI